MEIIMLGLKINHVRYSHGFVQPRMHGAARKIRKIVLFDTSNVGGARRPEFLQDILNGSSVVQSFVSLTVRHIGRAQGLKTGAVIVKPPRKKLFEVQKMSDVFLDRPTAAILPHHDYRR